MMKTSYFTFWFICKQIFVCCNHMSLFVYSRHMATIVKSMRIDEEVLKAFERMCAAKKERPTAVVQRMMMEAARRAGYWKEPKEK